jgi:hypothetical protein
MEMIAAQVCEPFYEVLVRYLYGIFSVFYESIA